MAKYKEGTYHKGYFRGERNIDINLITYEDKIVIPSILQSYLLYWYHMHFLHPGIYRAEEMIFKHFYSSGIRNTVQKEVTNYDTCQHTKRSNIKYVQLPSKESE